MTITATTMDKTRLVVLLIIYIHSSMFKNFLQSRWFALAGFALLVVLVTTMVRHAPLLTALNQEELRLDSKMAELKAQQDQLKEQGPYFQSAAYAEEQARIKLNYKKPGEHIVYVYHTNGSLDPASHSTGLAKPLKNWQEWWRYLLGD